MSTIPADITSSRTNGAMDDSKRNVKDHMLFEVSTEAANRGMHRALQLSRDTIGLLDQWEGSTP